MDKLEIISIDFVLYIYVYIYYKRVHKGLIHLYFSPTSPFPLSQALSDHRFWWFGDLVKSLFSVYIIMPLETMFTVCQIVYYGYFLSCISFGFSCLFFLNFLLIITPEFSYVHPQIFTQLFMLIKYLNSFFSSWKLPSFGSSWELFAPSACNIPLNLEPPFAAFLVEFLAIWGPALFLLSVSF